MITRNELLALADISVKEIEVPETIPVWGGMKLFIRQLTRGEQDEHLQRQFGATRMKQDARAKQQEISAVNIYGHDAWLCVHGICDESGVRIFKNEDETKLKEKSGEAIGWLAKQIIQFSGMGEDDAVAKGEKTAEQSLGDEIKNS